MKIWLGYERAGSRLLMYVSEGRLRDMYLFRICKILSYREVHDSPLDYVMMYCDIAEVSWPYSTAALLMPESIL